ncbi:MAG: DUF1311 domain-containing protein [Sphingomonadaceae bacterium]|nr:DUF1311 domain-containing protein [Sphingomonadaceae bacterium]MCP5384577.1 DUF1311 domain-containing protein [Altererythrobacter sp.]MCP5392229.1 DUF1311 domain-containing protein [Sphingomonadaceae bacterium]
MQLNDKEAAATSEDKCLGVNAEFGDAGYRKCWYDAAEESRQRVLKALARNGLEAAEADAEWEEIRQTNELARALDPSHVEALKKSQQAWEEYVDAQCVLEGYRALGGTAEPGFVSQCRDRLNLQRLAELRSPFIIEAQRDETLPEE